MNKLIVLRHLDTQDGIETRFCSGERDIPILPGQIIAFETIRQIRDLVGENPYSLAHTGLLRTKQTALLLGLALGYSKEMLVFPEFRERFGGELAGLQFSEIQKKFSKLNLKEPYELWLVEAPKQGLENVDAFLVRIEIGLRKIVWENIIILIAHAGAIKGIRAILETETLKEMRRILVSKTPENAEIFVFSEEENKNGNLREGYQSLFARSRFQRRCLDTGMANKCRVAGQRN